MSKTAVVNIRYGIDYDVYIGRAVGRWGLRESKWANPFKLGKGVSRESALLLYEEHLLNRPDLMAALGELKGKRLGCWCSPLACHGDVLVKWVEMGEADPPTGKRESDR